MAPLALPFLPAGERARWPERLGRAAPAPADAWVHGASLGESGAVRPLLDALRGAAPHARLHATATTRSGRERLAGFGVPATLAPLDAPAPVRRFFDALRPRRLLIGETELWPHWLIEAARRGTPVAFVSARLSERSLRGDLRLGAPLARLISGAAAVLCQTAEDARRWRALGARAERCEVTGNLKNDALPRPADRAAARLALGLDPSRPLCVLGSVRPGELERLAPLWRRLPETARGLWQVAVVPRHPRASAALAREERAAGLPVDGAGERAIHPAWRWDARLGVLRDYYAACEVAFVGGSLAPFGGHHPLEPAGAGAAVAIGPHHEAQAAAVRALEARGALPPIRDEAAALNHLAALLTDDAARASAAAAALAAAEAERGATARTMAALGRLGVWPPS
jgi:3-deoxy-D-manno-octulosonic-acid transferase